MLDRDVGVMLCGHGSRSPRAVAEFQALAEALRPRFEGTPVAYGYLEFANPVIRDGLDRLREEGASRILAVPGMLFAASHAKNDIPSVLNTYAKTHGVRVEYGRELGVDAKMLGAAADRVREAVAELDEREGPVAAADTCLVVVGRGASDPDANGNVAKVARLLWEGFGFGWCATAYSGVTFPLVAPCLERVTGLGFKRIIVFPYFLFSGILIDRIYGFTDEAAARHPGIQFAKAPYLGIHQGVLDTFVERVMEIPEGKAVMNCSMCKYRTQVLGFEAEVGAPQESHHHHVEGMGASAPGSTVETCTLCDTFCTGACRVLRPAHHHHHDHHHHDDDGGHHHHHHYPHEAHPLGPVSVVTRGEVKYEKDPEAITRTSFEIIRAEADLSRFGDEAAVAERIVHAAGDPAILADLVVREGFCRTVREALRDGAPLVTDSEMTRHAIARRLLAHERIVCHIADEETAAEAAAKGTTRSAVAISRAADRLDGAVVVIGNAPTALFALLEAWREGRRPAAIAAFPVGFVGAAESKAALLALDPPVPYATLSGRRGGSAMAGAAINAALIG